MAATKSTIPASGSLNWSTAANYSDLAVPVSTDLVTLGAGLATVDSGLAQQAVTLASLTIPDSFTGSVGTAAQNAQAVTSITRSSSTATVTTTANHGYSSGDTVVISGAVETDYNGAYSITVSSVTVFTYTVANTPSSPATGTILVQKAEELHIGATNARIGDASGSTTAGTGSGRIKANFGTVQTTIVVVKTGSSTDQGKEPVRVRGTHASNKAYILGGTVGFATNKPGDVATFTEISVSGASATANVGAGVTLATLRQTLGNATVGCAITSALEQDGGKITTQGSGAIAAANVGGIAYLNSTGTIATLTVLGGGTADFTQSLQARTVTTPKLYKGATLKYDPAVVTFTNPIQLIGCTLADVKIIVPQNATVAIVAT